jgi:hypothetical protein
VLMAVERNTSGTDTIAVWTGKGPAKALFALPNSVLGQLCYAPSGHVIFERIDGAGGIWAFPFSLEKMERTGEVFRIGERGSLPSASDDGTLAYSPADAARIAVRQMVWVDRTGKIVEPLGTAMDSLRAAKLSPDEHRIAAISRAADGNDAPWIFDTAHGNSMPLTQTVKLQRLHGVFWFPQGSELLFSGDSPGPYTVYSEPVDGWIWGRRARDEWLAA